MEAEHQESKLPKWAQRRLASERAEVLRLRRILMDDDRSAIINERDGILAAASPHEKSMHAARKAHPSAPTYNGAPLVGMERLPVGRLYGIKMP